MLVRDLMRPGVATIRLVDSLRDAARAMCDSGRRFLAVTDGHGAVVGAITAADVCRIAAFRSEGLEHVPVSDAISATLRAVGETDLISHAQDVMRLHHVRRLVVLDPVGRAAGILSITELARAASPGWTSEAGEVTPNSIVRLLADIEDESSR